MKRPRPLASTVWIALRHPREGLSSAGRTLVGAAGGAIRRRSVPPCVTSPAAPRARFRRGFDPRTPRGADRAARARPRSRPGTNEARRSCRPPSMRSARISSGWRPVRVADDRDRSCPASAGPSRARDCPSARAVPAPRPRSCPGCGEPDVAVRMLVAHRLDPAVERQGLRLVVFAPSMVGECGEGRERSERCNQVVSWSTSGIVTRTGANASATSTAPIVAQDVPGEGHDCDLASEVAMSAANASTTASESCPRHT